MKKIILFITLIATNVYANNIKQQYSIPCKELNVSNYFDILYEEESGIYKNPFNNKCVLISFKTKENKIDFSILKRYDKNVEKGFFEFINTEGVYVKHILDKSGEHYNFLKYDKNSMNFKYVKNVSRLFPLYYDFYEDITFLHEIFHLAEFDFNLTPKEQFIYEVTSDIAAIFIVSNQYELTHDEIIKLIQNAKYIRKRAFSDKDKINDDYFVIYDKSIDFIKNNKNFKKYNSFNEVFNLVKKIRK